MQFIVFNLKSTPISWENMFPVYNSSLWMSDLHTHLTQSYCHHFSVYVLSSSTLKFCLFSSEGTNPNGLFVASINICEVLYKNAPFRHLDHTKTVILSILVYFWLKLYNILLDLAKTSLSEKNIEMFTVYAQKTDLMTTTNIQTFRLLDKKSKNLISNCIHT